jgi:hypothetical protein
VGTTSRPGLLIAVEGSRGVDVAAEAARLWERLHDHKADGGISRWDASGTFYEVGLAKKKDLALGPRTLILLYASDLLFRLRWEIRPALEGGHVVVAAPYLETVFGFGAAVGLPRRWMNELFRFAPKADAAVLVKERKKASGWKGKPQDGFLEFCAATLATFHPTWNAAEARTAVIASLQTASALEPIGKKATHAIVKRVHAQRA